MRYFATLLGATALVAYAGAARADFVVGDSFPYSAYELLGGNVHITDAPLGIVNEYAGAGAIKLTNGASSVWAFCIDLADWLTPSGSYSFATVTAPDLAGDYAPGISKVHAIEAIMRYGADVYSTSPASQTMGTSAQRNEAAQLAIWKIEYGAALSVTPDDGFVSAILASDLDNVAAWATAYTGSALQMRPGNQPNQTLIYLDPPSTIPEPAPLALMTVAGVGLAALLLSYRRARPRRHG